MHINFYGGEPLLAFSKIKDIVASIQTKNQKLEKKIHFTISTNGSLIDESVLEFFAEYGVSPLISFDGLAQNITRKKGSFDRSIFIIENILDANINLFVNSVFTPETVIHLSKSMELLMEIGVKRIDLSLSTTAPWDDSAIDTLKGELSNLSQILLSFHKRMGLIPISEFSGKSKKGVFFCAAGRDRLSLAPDGKLWGCHLFSLYFSGKENSPEYQKYCFGDIDFFIENHERIYPQILRNYADLRMDFFYTEKMFCLFCDELEECSICPIYAALSSGIIRMIPPWICEIKRVFRKERSKFLKDLDLKPDENNSVIQ